MPSQPLDSKHSLMTLGVTCHHRLWTAHAVERCRAWHAIIAFGLADTVRQHRAWHAIIALRRQTRSNGIGRGMQSSPLGSTDSRTASGVACHHRPWATHTVGRCQASHAIIALGQHRRSAIVGRAMPSKPLDSTHDQTASGVACHHRHWTAQTVGRRRAWYAIIDLGRLTRSNDVGRGMRTPPLNSIHGRTTSGVVGHHRIWEV